MRTEKFIPDATWFPEAHASALPAALALVGGTQTAARQVTTREGFTLALVLGLESTPYDLLDPEVVRFIAERCRTIADTLDKLRN